MKGVDNELEIWNIKIIHNIYANFTNDSCSNCYGFRRCFLYRVFQSR